MHYISSDRLDPPFYPTWVPEANVDYPVILYINDSQYEDTISFTYQSENRGYRSEQIQTELGTFSMDIGGTLPPMQMRLTTSGQETFVEYTFGITIF